MPEFTDKRPPKGKRGGDDTPTNPTSSKPISLHPLSVEEALKKAMQATPPKKEGSEK